MPTETTVNIVVPALGESVVEATIARWLKQEGDTVRAGDPLVELETDKVDLEVPAEVDGILLQIDRQEGEDVQIGDILGKIDETAVDKSAPAPSQSSALDSTTSDAKSAQLPEDDRDATPVAKRMAAEERVDLEEVDGTGSGGRITKQDVEAYVRAQRAKAEPPSTPTPPLKVASTEVATTADLRGEERVRMSRRRRTIAARLVQVQQTAAMLTTFNEIDMSAVMDLRKRRQEAFVAAHGVKLGFTSFFTKATIGALKAFPLLNAEIEGAEIVLKRYYDIGIAVGAEEGLVVPVLRDADRMSFAQIEEAVKEFVGKSRDGTLSITDLMGGTFTITNGGVFGSMLSTPILNPPQVGILGLHKIEDRPVVLRSEHGEKEIAIRPMMYVALTYDHRVVDGREAVQFLVKVKELIEDPEALLLEG